MSMALGWVLLALGSLICAINIYASFIRYPLHRLRGRRNQDFRWVSGYPLVGSLLVGFAWIVWMNQLGWPALIATKWASASARRPARVSAVPRLAYVVANGLWGSQRR